MLKKIYISMFVLLGFLQTSFADNTPSINCVGLPACPDTNVRAPSAPNISDNVAGDYIRSAINILIDLVAVFAVFALIVGGIYYIVSGGNEEKIGKAKKIVLWALAGVILSVLSWGIVEFLNNITINV